MNCWEYRGCKQVDCQGYGRKMDFCWFSDNNCPHDEMMSFKDKVSNYCLGCPVFADKLSSITDKGSVETLQIIGGIIRRIQDCDTNLEGSYLKRKYLSNKLSQLYELSELMLSSLSVDRVLYIILTAVTSGQVLGFNRAFLFIVNEEETELRGEMAVGQIDPVEAGRIWSELESRPMTINQIVEEYERHPPAEQNRAINEVVKQVVIPLDHCIDSIFGRAVHEKVSYNNVSVEQCTDCDREFMDRINSKMITVVPIVTREKTIGALAVDNFVTNHPVSEDDLELLKLYANYAGLAIVNAGLYEKLDLRMRELEEMNEQLQRQRDLLIESEKFAAMGKTAASIAHEIKNPLVSIGGFARLAYRKIEDPTIRESLQVVINETARLENLLQNILSFARPPEPHFAENDLNSVVKDVALMIRREADESNNGVYVEVELCTDQLVFMFDRDLIQQVVLNLGRNAVQAMPNGGTVLFRTDVKGNFARVTVKDTGVGIPEEVRNSLFTPFFTTKSTGTGLGLAVAKHVVVKHGGFIDVTSVENEGSTFIVNIPMERQGDEK